MPQFKTFEEAKRFGDKNYLHPIIKKIKLTNDEIRYNVYETYGRNVR